jgi:hypothetical protein
MVERNRLRARQRPIRRRSYFPSIPSGGWIPSAVTATSSHL